MPRNPLPFLKSRAWKQLRRARMRKDKYTCRRCKSRFPYGQGLTVHHIIPRPRGTHSIQNLISLCEPCHNEVEGKNLIRHEIEHGFKAPEYVELVREFKDPDEIEDWRELDWRIRVYGGVKDFQAAKQIMAENAKS